MSPGKGPFVPHPTEGRPGFSRVCARCPASPPSPVRLSVLPSTWPALSSSSPGPGLLLQGFCPFGHALPTLKSSMAPQCLEGKVSPGASWGGPSPPVSPAHQDGSTLCAAPSLPPVPSAPLPNPPRPARPSSRPASSWGSPQCSAPGSLPRPDLHPVGDLWPLRSALSCSLRTPPPGCLFSSQAQVPSLVPGLGARVLGHMLGVDSRKVLEARHCWVLRNPFLVAAIIWFYETRKKELNFQFKNEMV